MTSRRCEPHLVATLCAVALGACAAPPPDPEPASDGLLFRNVRIFDGERVIPETEIVARAQSGQ